MSEGNWVEIASEASRLLEAAVVNACWDVLAPCRDDICIVDLDIALEQTSNVVLAVVARALKSVARSLNDRSAVARLPRELFCHIFELLPLKDRIRATHVCHSWRDAALFTPSAWSTVICRSTTAHGALTAVANRSGSSDLTLCVSADLTNWEEICNCLHAHLWRCVELELTILETGPGAESISRALCRPAPRLRTFRLWDSLGSFNDAGNRDALLFSGDAPNLDLVKMHTALANIRPCGSMRCVKRLMCRPAAAISLQMLADFLACFPCLEVLALELAPDKLIETDEDANGWLPCVLPPSLLEFRVISTGGSNILWPFSRVQIGRDLRLRAQYRELPGASEASAVVVRILCNAPVLQMQLVTIARDDGTVDVDVWSGGDQDEWTHRVYDIPRVALPLEEAFTTLTRLTVGEIFFAGGPPLPDAPLLTHLAVTLLCGANQVLFGEDSIFLLPRTREHVFSCAKLRTVELCATHLQSVRSGGYVTYLTPDMVRDFIEFHLRFDRPHLERLVLEGVRLVESRVEEVAALLALVQHVEWKPAYAEGSSSSRFEEVVDWDFLG